MTHRVLTPEFQARKHAVIHQAPAGTCRICDEMRRDQPGLFGPDVPDFHDLVCGLEHESGSAARLCANYCDGMAATRARNRARMASGHVHNALPPGATADGRWPPAPVLAASRPREREMTYDDAVALILRAAGER